jgi:glyoxylase I family protein
MIRGIHHIGLHTPNIQRMLDFYHTGLGFEILYEMEWRDSEAIDDVVDLKKSAGRVVYLRAGNVHIELLEYSAPPPRVAEPLRPCDYGYTHICFDVTDADAVWERMSKLGITFPRRPVDAGLVKLIYGKDPDGNLIEIQEIVAQDERIAFKNLKVLSQ